MREYRTIYGAQRAETCLREVLADFRPDAKAISDYESLFGRQAAQSEPFGVVPREWLRKNVLARAAARIASGTLADVEDPAMRRELTRLHAGLLAERGMRRLDIGELRGKDRVVTQAVSRSLFDKGHAGVSFRSHLDDGPCFAFFEFRARLEPLGDPLSLDPATPELSRVCREFGLRIGE